MVRPRAEELEDELAALRAALARERASRARAIERARLAAARGTAKRVTHELRNALSPVAGYGELLARRVPGADALLADRVKLSALRCAEFLNRLDRIDRYCEAEFGGEIMLDLDASTRAARGGGGQPGRLRPASAAQGSPRLRRVPGSPRSRGRPPEGP